MQEAVIIDCVRTPVGKAPRGMFRTVRPDDLLAHVLKGAIARVPGLDPKEIADVIVETEKSLVEIEAAVSGRLTEILVQVDQETQVGVGIHRGWIATTGDSLLASEAFMSSLPVPEVPTRIYAGTAGPRGPPGPSPGPRTSWSGTRRSYLRAGSAARPPRSAR